MSDHFLICRGLVGVWPAGIKCSSQLCATLPRDFGENFGVFLSFDEDGFDVVFFDRVDEFLNFLGGGFVFGAESGNGQNLKPVVAGEKAKGVVRGD